MHQAGLIRAIACALDCLAGVIIGVAALPQSILKADFKQARALLARINGAANAEAKAQVDFAARLESAIAARGSAGLARMDARSAEYARPLRATAE